MKRPSIAPPASARTLPDEQVELRHGEGSWLSDFKFRNGRLRVLKTGAELTVDQHLIADAATWIVYHLVVRGRSWMLSLWRRQPQVWFAPDRPRPWYLVWSALAWAGLRIAASPETADVAFFFEDATWSAACAPVSTRRLNFDCTNVSKSHVANVFEAVFGHPLAIDPETWTGPAVEKSEVNGVHDGRVIQCPTPAIAGRTYQRLIETSDEGVAIDLRTHCVGGEPVVVWVKRKPSCARFSIQNRSVTMRAPEAVYSSQELAAIRRFAAAMKLDWGGLDILREHSSGRLYIVDVNKTDVGPIIALSWRDKLRSTALLAAALQRLIGSGLGAAASLPTSDSVSEP